MLENYLELYKKMDEEQQKGFYKLDTKELGLPDSSQLNTLNKGDYIKSDTFSWISENKLMSA